MLDEHSLNQVRILILRLERLPADSIWAHRAGGLRGSLLRMIEKIESGEIQDNMEKLEELIEQGIMLLAKAIKPRRNKLHKFLN